jgi:hypothetical protein
MVLPASVLSCLQLALLMCRSSSTHYLQRLTDLHSMADLRWVLLLAADWVEPPA